VLTTLAGWAARPEPPGLDFHTYAAAAEVGSAQGWSHIYDQALIATTQIALVPSLVAQPFLSPPPVAWLAAGLLILPYDWAFAIWAAGSISALVAAVAWSSSARGLAGWVAGGVVVTTGWVLIGDRVGQVVPLVAVGVVVAWGFVRRNRDVAAGLALALLLLKPNTAFLVPLALLAAGRIRVFTTWLIATLCATAIVLSTVGVHGMSTYLTELMHPPPGTDALSLEAALGVSGLTSLSLRLAVVAAVLGGAVKLRASPGQAIVLGVIGSLVTTPYLHLSDLTLLAAAGWIAWQERPTIGWRALLAATWFVASPIAGFLKLTPTQNRWTLLELAWLILIVGSALRVDQLLIREAKALLETRSARPTTGT
jgi:hypothetical protein